MQQVLQNFKSIAIGIVIPSKYYNIYCKISKYYNKCCKISKVLQQVLQNFKSIAILISKSQSIVISFAKF